MEAVKKKKEITMDLLNGPIWKTLMIFSVPFMISTLLQTLYSTTDTIVVGQVLGKNGLSAVANGSQLMQMAYTICIGFSNAGQVLIAQAKGANNSEKIGKIINSLFILETALSALIGIVLVIFNRQILGLMNTPQEVILQARSYVIICGAGMIFTGLYNMISAVLRGMGDSRHPLIFVIIATSLNVVLDILFVVGFRWDIAGAALATVIGQAVSVFFSIRFLMKNGEMLGVKFHLRTMRLDSSMAKKISAIGVPMAFQSAAVQFSFVFVASMVNSMGVTVSAAFGVMQKIRTIPGIITQSLGLGSASMIGQNLGAHKTDRVSKTVKYCILSVSVINACFAVMYLGFPVFLFRLFTQDVDVLAYAAMTMLCLAIELPANCFMPACNSLVSAQGFVKLSMFVALLDAFVGRVFFCWFLGIFLELGAFGFCLGYVIGTYITAGIVFVYFISGKWKNREVLV